MEKTSHTVRVGVLDNDPLALRMFKGVLLAQQSIDVLWLERRTSVAVQSCLSELTRPDVLLIDMALEGISGIDVCKKIKRLTGSIRVIGVTAYQPNIYRGDAISSGMEQVLSKTDMRELIASIFTGPERDRVPADAPLNKYANMRARDDERPRLSARELETLRCFSQGLMTNEAMERLAVTKSTLATYEHRALKKLGTRTRTEAIAVCVRLHLL